MANEITLNIYGNLANGSYIKDSQNLGNVQFTQAGNAIYSVIHDLTTSASALAKGSIGTIGYMFVTNVSSAGNVLLSTDNDTTYPISIPPNATIMLTPVSGITITEWFLKMSTGSGSAHVRMWEA
jgi:hypothetical protein